MDSLILTWSFIAASLAFYWSRQALERLDRQAEAIRDLRFDVSRNGSVAASAPAAARVETPKKEPPFKSAPKPPRPPAPDPEEVPLPRPVFECPDVSWEGFTAGQVFSWVGGFALFLGAAFFVKYSIEHGLVTPLMRIVMGAGLGFSAVAAGLSLERGGDRKVVVTAHTLCAAGIGILYADVFAAHAVFGFLTMSVAAVLMGATTLAAFMLSVRMNSRYIAVLALLSGFLTPPLLSTGSDHTFILFSYIAVLNLGILATAIRKEWGFLSAMAALGTALIEWGWTVRFLTDSYTLAGALIFAFFPLLFAGAREAGAARGVEDAHLDSAAGVMPFTAMAFAAYALFAPAGPPHPWLLFSLVAFCGVLLSALALRKEEFHVYHAAAGAFSTVLLALWMGGPMTGDSLSAGLVFTCLFSVLHAAFPWILERVHPDAKPFAFSGVIPLLMLALLSIPILRGRGDASGIWFAVLFIDAAAIAAAIALGMTHLLTFALLGTMGLLGLAVTQVPMGEYLAVLSVFSLGFFGLGAWLQGKERSEGLFSLAALSSLTPFVLTAIATLTAPDASVHLIFLFTTVLAGMNVYLVRRLGNDDAAWGLLAGVLITALAWGAPVRGASEFSQILPWLAILFGMVALLPFLDPEVPKERAKVWKAAAAAGPAMFLPIHHAVSGALGDSCIGVLPALFAVLYAVACHQIVGEDELTDPAHQTRLAWFGGVALFFVSLIVPLQFDKEWITLGWAFEGVALLVLYRSLPHAGLKLWAGGLLAAVFVRLAANPAVFLYHPRAETPILNWFLWVYGAAIISFFAAARQWKPEDEAWGGCSVAGALAAAGSILAFLLMNIEIADFFSTGRLIVFSAAGNLPKDLSYTLGWGVFGMGLLLVGLRWEKRGARLGSVGLLSVAIGKLFLHDIWQLGQLYRVAALVGLAVILIAASFLYQSFLPELTRALGGRERLRDPLP